MVVNLKRRNFLKGAFGVTIGLPFLESLYFTEAQAQAADHKFGVFIRQPSGVIMENYWPSAEGAFNTALVNGKSLSPLAAIANQILLVRGIRYRDTNGNSCHHATGMSQLFTGGAVIRTGDGQNNLQAKSESLDNRIAREYKHPVLALYAHGTHDDRCMTSFQEKGLLQGATYAKPFAAYRSMFAMDNTGSDDPKALLKSSAIDYVHEELKQLMASSMLGSEDKQKLEAHFALVRETELKMATITPEQLKNLEAKGSANKANDNNSSMQDIIKLHMDVTVLAISAAGRRSANIQIGDIINQITYTSGMVSQHENTHKCAGIADLTAKQVDYDRLHNELFLYLAQALNKIKIGTGTLLDQGVIMMGSEVGDGRTHSLKDIPIVLAGSLGGKLKQGQFVKLGETMNSKLLNTIGTAWGLKNKAGNGLMNDFGEDNSPPEFGGIIDRLLA
ncbi:MAG: DUF1552 domain-containing protein [Proteobacteria bacterium]|nr:MAG: DUF1552 domain-containing protein [Pseudomonadota bacterium]